jgi:hypothetical protein
VTYVQIPGADLTAAPDPVQEALIMNDGFFPDIEPGAVREAARITTSITPARLRAAILGALLTLKGDLRAYKTRQIAAGHARLDDVPADELDGQSELLITYHRAVALYAKAELIERHRDFDTTSAGGNQADELTPSIGDLRRDALHAVRDILGKARTTVDLI